MLLDLSDLSNLLIVRFVTFKVLGSSVNGVALVLVSYNQNKKLTKKRKETRTNLINHSILSHGAQIIYMLGAADMISSRLPGRSLRFHSSSELQSKTKNSPKKRRKKQELTL